jgi:exportin-2 (importin alpha re-exporter)
MISIFVCTKNFCLARNDNQGDPNLGIYLKIYKKLLQVFRHFSSQDLHPYIEDNLSAWLGILKGTLGAQPGGLTGNVMKIAGDGLESLWFKCKGEAINCILLYSTKYQDDIMEMLQPFANEIWGVCQQNASGNTKILVNSLKYFRTFAQNEKFSGFFEQNMFEFFTKLLLPNFQPTEDAFDAFENEADSYVEALYDNVEICKRSEMAAGFLRTLSRYHNEKVQAIIFQVIGDYYNNEKSKGITNPTTEIVVLKLVFYSLVTGYRRVTGTSEITMSQEIITATYTNIVQPTLASVFNTIEQDPLGTYTNVHQI